MQLPCTLDVTRASAQDVLVSSFVQQEDVIAAPERGNPHFAVKTAQLLILLSAFSMGFMQPPVSLLGFIAVPGDFIFLALGALWTGLAISRRTPFIFDRAYYFLGAYLLAMAASAVARDVPLASAPKLLTQLYLVAIPVLVCNLVRDSDMLRHVVRWWLAGTAIVVAVAVGSLTLFAIDPGHPLLGYTRFHFGTLPEGNYPRLRLTFLNANLACNYLTLSLMILLAAGRQRWVSRSHFLLLLGGILVAGASTISPGLGGIALAVGLWMWLLLRSRRPGPARLCLAGGIAGALLFVLAMVVTPIRHPTAPFLIHVPGLDLVLAPSGRLMIWMDAATNFFQNPVLGRGIGTDAVLVRYQDPSGNLQELTDAHNIFLSIAVQCGAIGLFALLALIGHVVWRTVPLRVSNSDAGVFRLAFGLGLLNGLVYQGIGGSFEDARHLWLVFGLLLATTRIERSVAGIAASNFQTPTNS